MYIGKFFLLQYYTSSPTLRGRIYLKWYATGKIIRGQFVKRGEEEKKNSLFFANSHKTRYFQPQLHLFVKRLWAHLNLFLTALILRCSHVSGQVSIYEAISLCFKKKKNYIFFFFSILILLFLSFI